MNSHANHDHPNTPAARATCRRQALKGAARNAAANESARQKAAAKPKKPVRGCDYCGGPKIDQGYKHTDITCPGYGSHLVLMTEEDLRNLIANMLKQDYSITAKQAQKVPYMKHHQLVNLIIKLWKTQGEPVS